MKKTMGKLVLTMLAWCVVAGLAFIACSDPAKTGGTTENPVTIKSITIVTEDGEPIDKTNGIEGVIGGELQFYVEIETDPEDAPANALEVTWSVAGGTGDSYFDEDEEGLLLIDEGELESPSRFNANSWLTVTATSTTDHNKKATARVKLVKSEEGGLIPGNERFPLNVELSPLGAATLAIRVGTTTAVIQNGAEVLAGSKVGIYYTQTTAQRTNYTFEGITAEPEIADFGTGDGTSSAKRWVFEMPAEETTITLAFENVSGVEDPTLTWTVGAGGTIAVSTVANNASITSGNPVSAGTQIKVVVLTGENAAITGVTTTAGGLGTVAAPWVFTMPATDTSFAVTFEDGEGPPEEGEDPKLSWVVTPVGAAGLEVKAGGTTILTGNTVAEGTTVTIVASLNSGFVFGNIAGAQITGQGTTASPWTFTMPANNTTITVTYTAVPEGPGGDVLLIYDDGTKPGYTTIIAHHDNEGNAALNNFTLNANEEGYGSDNATRTGIRVNITTISNWLGLEIKAATAVDISQYSALSFKIRGTPTAFKIASVSFGGDDILEVNDPARVTYEGETGEGFFASAAWQEIIVPIPSTKANPSKSVFCLVAHPVDIDGKNIYLDEIKLIKHPNMKLDTIILPAAGGNVTHKAAPNNTIPLSVFGRKAELRFASPLFSTGTATLFGKNLDIGFWYDDVVYTVGGTAAAKAGDNLATSGTGTFTLGVGFGTKTSNNMTLNVREATLPLDNGYPANEPWSQIGTFPVAAFPAARPTPTPGMIDDFTYVYHTKADGHNWAQQLIGAPYWYGSDPPAIDAQCQARNNGCSIQMFGEDLGGWASIGRTGFCLNLTTYTSISFGAAETSGARYTFALQSGDEELGTAKSHSFEFTPTNAGSTITIPLSTFSSNGVDLGEITSYTFNYVPGSSTSGAIGLWVYNGIRAQ